MVDAIKNGVLPTSGMLQPQKAPSQSPDGASFGEFFKADMKDFLQKSHELEGMMGSYISGTGNIEEIAPKLKELMLEFEVKTKIISSLANIIKSLTSMNI